VDKLNALLRNPKTAESVSAVKKLLESMTVKQLMDLKRQRKVKASGLKAELVDKIANRLPYGRVDTSRISGFEQRSGISWLCVLVGILASKSKLSSAHAWIWLIEGRYNDRDLGKILEDENFAWDFGTMSVGDLKRVVDSVKNQMRPLTEIKVGGLLAM
jgi:hypothetical protein